MYLVISFVIDGFISLVLELFILSMCSYVCLYVMYVLFVISLISYGSFLYVLVRYSCICIVVFL